MFLPFYLTREEYTPFLSGFKLFFSATGFNNTISYWASPAAREGQCGLTNFPVNPWPRPGLPSIEYLTDESRQGGPVNPVKYVFERGVRVVRK